MCYTLDQTVYTLRRSDGLVKDSDGVCSGLSVVKLLLQFHSTFLNRIYTFVLNLVYKTGSGSNGDHEAWSVQNKALP